MSCFQFNDVGLPNEPDLCTDAFIIVEYTIYNHKNKETKKKNNYLLT